MSYFLKPFVSCLTSTTLEQSNVFFTTTQLPNGTWDIDFTVLSQYLFLDPETFHTQQMRENWTKKPLLWSTMWITHHLSVFFCDQKTSLHSIHLAWQWLQNQKKRYLHFSFMLKRSYFDLFPNIEKILIDDRF